MPEWRQKYVKGAFVKPSSDPHDSAEVRSVLKGQIVGYNGDCIGVKVLEVTPHSSYKVNEVQWWFYWRFEPMPTADTNCRLVMRFE